MLGMSLYMDVSHRQISIALTENGHQGKYHLLTILLLPGFLVALFLSKSWIVPVIYSLVAGIILWQVFRKR